ncbi:hypothetical protein [Promicromonospora kroppenstedtii]|uniref:hypothetical protein n=1 Tax=Promicromonospora kroppenstedtii TaxID=440482 RepID=UPI0004B59792|nr:hypothetical protein [Promicromonospora kroppenstedtii]
MTPKPTIADRIRDDAALIDGTHQGAQMLLHLLGKHRDAATDDIERDYWQTRIDVTDEADRAMQADLHRQPLRVLALQERWIAEIKQLRDGEHVS